MGVLVTIFDQTMTKNKLANKALWQSCGSSTEAIMSQYSNKQADGRIYATTVHCTMTTPLRVDAEFIFMNL